MGQSPGPDESLWAQWPAELRLLAERLLTGTDENGVQAPISVLSARFDGAFDYRAGVSGTPSLPTNARVVALTAEARDDGAATVQIDGGDVVQIRPSGTFRLGPEGKLLNPVIVFGNTRQYFVQLVSMSTDEDPS